jgi:hypothetical protein
MNYRAARGIAANMSVIAQSTAKIALIEGGHHNPAKGGSAGQIADLQNKIKRAEEHIADWLQQPMAWSV